MKKILTVILFLSLMYHAGGVELNFSIAEMEKRSVLMFEGRVKGIKEVKREIFERKHSPAITITYEAELEIVLVQKNTTGLNIANHIDARFKQANFNLHGSLWGPPLKTGDDLLFCIEPLNIKKGENGEIKLFLFTQNNVYIIKEKFDIEKELLENEWSPGEIGMMLNETSLSVIRKEPKFYKEFGEIEEDLKKKRMLKNIGIYSGIVVGGLSVLLVLYLVFRYFRNRRKQSK
jgi:hypothetical protein